MVRDDENEEPLAEARIVPDTDADAIETRLVPDAEEAEEETRVVVDAPAGSEEADTIDSGLDATQVVARAPRRSPSIPNAAWRPGRSSSANTRSRMCSVSEGWARSIAPGIAASRSTGRSR